jgi:TonB family protein
MENKNFKLSVNQKIILGLVLILSVGIVLPREAMGQTDGSGVTPYVAVEEMPSYPGGNSALVKFISNNIKYPPSAMEKGIQGKVIVKLCVTAQGGVSMVSVLKGVDPDLDKEAMRVVSSIKSFNPGKKAGVPVPVWYLIPITFAVSTN